LTKKTDEIMVHPKWLRFMFAVNIFLTGGFALAMLIMGQAFYTYFGFPTEEPILAGYVPSYMFALAIMSILGMRSPVKFSPVLLLQATGKVVWFLAVIIPQLAIGPLPAFALMLSAQFILIIIGDLIAVPWKYLLAKSN
jgi:hypothetical protein